MRSISNQRSSHLLGAAASFEASCCPCGCLSLSCFLIGLISTSVSCESKYFTVLVFFLRKLLVFIPTIIPLYPSLGESLEEHVWNFCLSLVSLITLTGTRLLSMLNHVMALLTLRSHPNVQKFKPTALRMAKA